MNARLWNRRWKSEHAELKKADYPASSRSRLVLILAAAAALALTGALLADFARRLIASAR